MMNKTHLSTDAAQLLKRLQEVFLFRDWATEDLIRLTHLGRVIRPAKGKILFLHEASCSHLYVLMRGKVQMFRNTPEGREITASS